LRLSIEAKPFGFSAGCDSCNSRLLLLSNNASPHQFAFPLTGHDAREHRDEDVGYTLRSKPSQEENTLRTKRPGLWKSLWKILPARNPQQIRRAAQKATKNLE
jgi:hypothetical protein